MLSEDLRRILRVANLAARGDDPADVIMAAQAELMALLDLRDCRFEAAPYCSPLTAGAVELPVLGRGFLLGRMVLTPTPGVGLSEDQRVVAVALADQVGAVLAAQRRDPLPGG